MRFIRNGCLCAVPVIALRFWTLGRCAAGREKGSENRECASAVNQLVLVPSDNARRDIYEARFIVLIRVWLPVYLPESDPAGGD